MNKKKTEYQKMESIMAKLNNQLTKEKLREKVMNKEVKGESAE